MPLVRRKPTRLPSLSAAKELLRTPACKAFAQGYAKSVAAQGGTLPSKNGLDLANFITVMPHTALVAVTIGGSCEYRLVGENLKERHKFNATGRDYYDFVPEERQENARKAMEMVVAVPCGFRVEILQTYADGRRMVIEALGLPLLSDEPGVDGFIMFADNPQEDMSYSARPQKEWLGANILQRHVIDLGFGVDESFEDLILEAD